MPKTGFFVATPPKVDLLEEKLPKDKGVQKLIKDIPVLLKPEIKKEAIDCIKATVNDVRAGKLIDKEGAKKVVSTLVEEVMKNYKHTLLNLIDIRHHDEYTFAHSINVCVLSILMGIKKRMEKEELEELGLGGLLHDLGKIRIEHEILNKPGKLTHEEINVMKHHPTYGYEILCFDQEIGEIPREIAYQHHEQYDGGGYPRGICGNAIHEYATIAALADVYDALTTNRPYRKSFLPHDAMRIMITDTETKFSHDAIRLFLEHMSIYPVGSMVRLNSGEVAVVIISHEKALIRPTLRMILDPRGDYYPDAQEVDLRRDRKRFIVGSVGDDVFLKRH
ncbi:HD-GYP domain-containing protein [Candidatus Desantisbacteria bacterium]|nr:HD-GYP domain-containing protein [Candidatus Desantisbacteria bacterium]